MSEHASLPPSLAYPPELLDMEAPELLQISQQQANYDTRVSYQYAMAAYDRALAADVPKPNPVIVGRSAAMAGLQAARLGRPWEESMNWFLNSNKALSVPTPQIDTGTALLWEKGVCRTKLGQAESIYYLRDRKVKAGETSHIFDEADWLLRSATRNNRKAHALSAAMSAHAVTQRAIFEAADPEGPSTNLPKLISQGLKHAIVAKRMAEYPEVPHGVARQLQASAVIVGLGLSRPLDGKVWKVSTARQKLALRWLR